MTRTILDAVGETTTKVVHTARRHPFGVTAAAVALIWWAYAQFASEDPIPQHEVFVSVAEDYWGSGFCYDGEYKWPCAIPTEIRLEQEPVPSAHGYDGTFRACYLLTYELENTPWDAANDVVSHPRTFVRDAGTARQCADVSHRYGPSEQADSWFFAPLGKAWYMAPTQAARDALCANSYGPFNCP